MTELTAPTLAMKAAILRYQEEFDPASAGIPGTSWLTSAASVADWLASLAEMAALETGGELVPAQQFVVYEQQRDKILGMINLRLALNDYLSLYGGHVGYSVAPSERRQGVAKMMLGQLKEIACRQGLTELLITASEGNEASICTILDNGGRFEKKVTDPATGEMFCHYWVETSQRE